MAWDFPGGPVVKTPYFHLRGGTSSNPGEGTKIPHTTGHHRKKKLTVINLDLRLLTQMYEFQILLSPTRCHSLPSEFQSKPCELIRKESSLEKSL